MYHQFEQGKLAFLWRGYLLMLERKPYSDVYCVLLALHGCMLHWMRRILPCPVAKQTNKQTKIHILIRIYNFHKR